MTPITRKADPRRDTRARLAALLAASPGATRRELAASLGISRERVGRLLAEAAGREPMTVPPDETATAYLDLPTRRQREAWRRASARERDLFAEHVRQHLEAA